MKAHILSAGDRGGACHLFIFFSMSQGAGLYHLLTQACDLLSSKAGSQDSCNPRITALRRRVRQENCYEFRVSQGYIVSLSQNKIFWRGGSCPAVIPASGDEVIPGQLEIHGELQVSLVYQ